MKGLVILLNVVCFFHVASTQNDVRRPPSITKNPGRYQHFKDGGEVHLECEADGIPAVTYAWEQYPRNVSLLTMKEFNYVRRWSGSSLRMQSLGVEDDGLYVCFAINQYGTAISSFAMLSRAYLDEASGVSKVINITVHEGSPFVIPADRQPCYPAPSYKWEIATSTTDRAPRPLQLSRRIQAAFNGDLHFAYAEKEDELDGDIYKSTVYNPVTYETSRGIYSRVIVIKDSENVPDFPPAFRYSYFSGSTNFALLGRNIILKCFVPGKPAPTITWSGPGNTLPQGRHEIASFGTELRIYRIIDSDDGDYVCTSTNPNGTTQHMLYIGVQVPPNFNQGSDGPHNVNVTEGDSVTFNCSASGRPTPFLLWFQNGKRIIDRVANRFVFSNDNRSLTIRNVCRDCVGRESKTDLMVIQCLAANAHDYVGASGYLNVLLKTEVIIKGPKNVMVDFREQKHLIFQCIATSDPSTPTTVQWYKTEPHGDLVRDEPPYVLVAKEFLVIMVYPNCSSECAKYLGEYRCVGYNGYSRGNQTITLDYQYNAQEDADVGLLYQKEEPWAVWKIIVIAGTISLVLFLIGAFLCYRRKRIFGVFYEQTEDRKLSASPKTYGPVGYESVDIPVEGIGNKERSMPRPGSVYDHIGYDSIDQVLGEIKKRGGALPHPPQGNIGYESIDTPQLEATDRCKSKMDGDDKYDNMGYAIPLEEVTNLSEIDQNQTHGNDTASSASTKIPHPNEQPGEMDTSLDLIQKETDSHSYLVPKEMRQYLDLVSNEVNTYLDLSPDESNQYLDLSPEESNQYLDLSPEESNQYLDLSPEESNQYLDLSQKEVTQDVDLDPKYVNQYVDLHPEPREGIPYLDPGRKEMNHHVYLDPKDVGQCLDQDSEPRDVNPYLDLSPDGLSQCLKLGDKGGNQNVYHDPKEVNENLGLILNEVNKCLDLDPKEANQCTDPKSRDENQYTSLGPTGGNPYLDLGSKKVITPADLCPKE